MSDFMGDAAYACWQRGGNPDRLDRDRGHHAEQRGEDGYNWGAAEAARWERQAAERREAARWERQAAERREEAYWEEQAQYGAWQDQQEREYYERIEIEARQEAVARWLIGMGFEVTL